MMKHIRLTLAAALYTFAGLASAATFNLFQPASGILVGNPNTYVTTAATSSNVLALWSGTCNSTTFLRGDGQCSTVSTATGANPTASVGLTAVNGSSSNFMRADAAPALSQSISPTWTQAHLWSASAPRIRFNSTGAAADEKQWHVQSNSVGTFNISTRTDADGSGTDFLTVSRTGTTPNVTTLNTGTLTVNATSATNFSNTASTTTFAGTTRFTATTSPAIATDTTNITSRTGATNVSASVQFTGSGADLSSVSHTRSVTSNAGPTYYFNKARGSVASPAVVLADDVVGVSIFSGHDGTNFTNAARVEAAVDGTPGAGDMPGRLVFSTTADGSSTPSERFRINNAGAWGLSGANFGTSGQVLTSNGSTGAPTWQNVGGTGDALLAGNNTFTNSGNNVTNTVAQWGFRETSATADEGNWLLRADGDQFTINAATDANPTSAASSAFAIGRTGTTIDYVQILGGALVTTSTTKTNLGYGAGTGQATIGTLGQNAVLQAASTAAAALPGMSFARWENTASPGYFVLGKSRGSTIGNYTAVQSGDEIARVEFAGADGTDVTSVAASIATFVDGTPGNNDMPGRLAFSTAADGAASPTERMRIDSSGDVTVFNGLVASGSDVPIRKNVDTNRLLLLGGTINNLANGARISIYGNAHASTPGDIVLTPGNAAGSDITLDDDTTVNGALTATSLAGSGSGITALNAGNISTGTLPVARGGTGTTTSTGTGSVVLSASPTFTGTAAFAAATVGGSAVCRADGTNCPSSTPSNEAWGTFNTTSSSCTLVSVSSLRSPSCSRTALGTFTVSWSPGMTNTPTCIVSANDNTINSTATVTFLNNFSAQVVTRSGGSAADNISFSFRCMGS